MAGTAGAKIHNAGRGYGAGVAVAALTALLLTWVSIVRDDGSGDGFFLVILAAGVGGYATHFAAAGMARTMLGVAAMQAAFGLAVATAPVTAAEPDGVVRAIAFHTAFTILWLIAARLFRRAARRGAGQAAGGDVAAKPGRG